MELVKLIVLVVLAAQCHGQTSVGSGDMTSAPSPSPSPSPTPDPEPPVPDILEVNVTRAYRFNDPMDNTSFYQSVYGSIYENSSPFRYAHYNVSLVAAL